MKTAIVFDSEARTVTLSEEFSDWQVVYARGDEPQPPKMNGLEAVAGHWVKEYQRTAPDMYGLHWRISPAAHARYLAAGWPLPDKGSSGTLAGLTIKVTREHLIPSTDEYDNIASNMLDELELVGCMPFWGCRVLRLNQIGEVHPLHGGSQAKYLQGVQGDAAAANVVLPNG